MLDPSEFYDRQAPYQINALTTTSVEVAAAVAGTRYRVMAYQLSSATNALITLKSGTTTICGAGIQILAAGTNNVVASHNQDGWFETVAGAALNIVADTTADGVSGTVNFIKIK